MIVIKPLFAHPINRIFSYYKPVFPKRTSDVLLVVALEKQLNQIEPEARGAIKNLQAMIRTKNIKFAKHKSPN